MTRPRLPMMRPRSPGLVCTSNVDVVATLVGVDEDAVGIVDEMPGDVLDRCTRRARRRRDCPRARRRLRSRRPLRSRRSRRRRRRRARRVIGSRRLRRLTRRPLRRRLRPRLRRVPARAGGRRGLDRLRLRPSPSACDAASLPSAALYASQTPAICSSLAALLGGLGTGVQPVQRPLAVDRDDRRLLAGRVLTEDLEKRPSRGLRASATTTR